MELIYYFNLHFFNYKFGQLSYLSTVINLFLWIAYSYPLFIFLLCCNFSCSFVTAVWIWRNLSLCQQCVLQISSQFIVHFSNLVIFYLGEISHFYVVKLICIFHLWLLALFFLIQKVLFVSLAPGTSQETMEVSGKKEKKGEREENYRKIFPFCTFLNFALTFQT